MKSRPSVRADLSSLAISEIRLDKSEDLGVKPKEITIVKCLDLELSGAASWLLLGAYLRSFWEDGVCETVYIPKGTVREIVVPKKGKYKLSLAHDVLSVSPSVSSLVNSSIGIFHLVEKENEDANWLDESVDLFYYHCLGQITIDKTGAFYKSNNGKIPSALMNYEKAQFSSQFNQVHEWMWQSPVAKRARSYESGTAIKLHERVTDIKWNIYLRFDTPVAVFRLSKHHSERVIIEKKQTHLGEGAFGDVGETSAFYIDEDGYKLPPKTLRVIKNIRYRDGKKPQEKQDECKKQFVETVNREYELAKAMGLRPKPPVFNIFNKSIKNAYLLMWRVPGTTLFKFMREKAKDGDRLTFDQAFQISINCMKALAELHEKKNILHADVKNNNMMIDPKDLRCRLIDAGLAVRKDEKYHYSAAKGYKCPEYIKAKFSDTKDPIYHSEKTEAYAMGLLLCDIWGFYYQNDSSYKNAYQLGDVARNVKSLDLSVQPHVRELVSQLLCVDPEKRILVSDALKRAELYYASYQDQQKNQTQGESMIRRASPRK